MAFIQKEVELQLHLIFGVTADSEEEAKEDCGYFMQWVREQFTQWDESILQYFLYEYGLTQDGRYTLDLHIDRVIDNDAEDETVSSAGEKPKKDDTNIDNVHEVNGDNLDDLLDEALDDQTNPSNLGYEPPTRPQDVNTEVENPMNQVTRLVKKKRKKRREND